MVFSFKWIKLFWSRNKKLLRLEPEPKNLDDQSCIQSPKFWYRLHNPAQDSWTSSWSRERTSLYVFYFHKNQPFSASSPFPIAWSFAIIPITRNFAPVIMVSVMWTFVITRMTITSITVNTRWTMITRVAIRRFSITIPFSEHVTITW